MRSLGVGPGAGGESERSDRIRVCGQPQHGVAFRKVDNDGSAFYCLDQTGAQIGVKTMRQPVAGCPGHGALESVNTWTLCSGL